MAYKLLIKPAEKIWLVISAINKAGVLLVFTPLSLLMALCTFLIKDNADCRVLRKGAQVVAIIEQ